MQEAKSWEEHHARNETETSGLQGWGKQGWGRIFSSWGAGRNSGREVAMAAGWPCH